MMGSGAEAADETVDALTAGGERSASSKSASIARSRSSISRLRSPPPKKIAVLDRCKEAGAAGEPLYLDIVNGLHESSARTSK